MMEQVYQAYRNGAGICTDSRKLQKGDIFFALKGPNFNGNLFAEEAIRQGAALSIVDDPELKITDQCLVVDDVLLFLQQLATHHRRQLAIPVIGIAGSNGKTTTKELMRAVLSTSYNTFATPGNFNNEIGVPLALLMMKPNTEVAIIEMGARNLGDIAELCEIAEPTHGLVTNTGKDHMETFGTIENTRKTNAELYVYLADHGGTALANIAYQDLLAEIPTGTLTITYGGNKADVPGEVVSSFPYLTVAFNDDKEANSKLVGKYNFENVMAAIAVGKALNVADALMAKAIAAYEPSNNRSQLLQKGSNTFIMDAYNANPSSMEQALISFEELKAEHKVVILGDMLELGPTSEEEHLLMVLRLKKMGLDNIVLVGPEFGKVKHKLNCQHFDSNVKAAAWFNQQQFTNTMFLLKGSRGIALEKVIA